MNIKKYANNHVHHMSLQSTQFFYSIYKQELIKSLLNNAISSNFVKLFILSQF